MGYMRHNCIVVTAPSYDSWPERAHAKALEVFGDRFVTPLLPEAVNGYQSFLVGPDGSKEGWHESDTGDRKRALFVEWLRAQAYEDGSSSLAWVEVQYGDDNLETKIVDDSDAGRRNRAEDA